MVKYIEDNRSMLERNRDAREYSYKCRRERESKWDWICRKVLAISLLLFVMACLVGAAV